MNPILKNILAVVLGWLGGSIITMGLVQLGHAVLPIEGVDPNDMEALAQVLPTLEPHFFAFPFLAHALGTFAGAIIAGLIAASHKMRCSMAIGILFLIGGILVSFMLPGPVWFSAVDIIFAYIPMAWLGGRIAKRLSNKN